MAFFKNSFIKQKFTSGAMKDVYFHLESETSSQMASKISTKKVYDNFG